MIVISMIIYLGFQSIPLIAVIHIARNASMYTAKSRIVSGITVPSKTLSKILILQHKGFNDRYMTNISSRYTYYYINPRPNTVSKVGLFSWFVGGLATLMWCVSVHLFLFDIDSAMISKAFPVIFGTVFLLTMVDIWNKGSPRIQDSVDWENVISREMFESIYRKKNF